LIGVDVSKGRGKCRGCKQRIAKGEKRFWYLGGEYYGRPNIYYWHPKCFLEHNRKVVIDIITVFLPLLIGDEAAKPIIIALNLTGSNHFGG